MSLPPWLTLIAAGLSVHQLSFLLSKKEGPWSVFARVRKAVKAEAKESTAVRKSAVQRGIDCQHCTSVWFAFPVASFLYFRHLLPEWVGTSGDVFILFTALASFSVILNQAFTKD